MVSFKIDSNRVVFYVKEAIIGVIAINTFEFGNIERIAAIAPDHFPGTKLASSVNDISETIKIARDALIDAGHLPG